MAPILEELTGMGTIGNGMGTPSYGHTSRALELSSQEAKAEDNAMNYLQRSLNSANEISTSQGIAAALLAAIPMIGGGIIGRSVGNAEVPQGVYNAGKLAPTGANIGGQMGVQAGLTAGQGYLGGIKEANKNEADVYQKMSALESRRAERLGQESSQVTNAGLAIDSKIAMMPLELQQFAQEQELQLRKQKELAGFQNSLPVRQSNNPYLEGMTQEQKEAYYAKQTGVNADGTKVAEPLSLAASQESSLAKRKAFIMQAENTARGLETFNSWADLKVAQASGALDGTGAVAAVRDLSDILTRIRSGAAVPPAERAQISQFLAGDQTVTPAQMAQLIRNQAERERLFGKAELDTYINLNKGQTDIFGLSLEDQERKRLQELRARK